MSLANCQVQSSNDPGVNRSQQAQESSSSQADVPDVGIALFDDPQAPATGWCSVAGQDSYRFSGLSDLRNNVVWVTNLDYGAYSAFAKSLTNVRRSDYFRGTIAQMAADLGFQASGAHARDASKKLSAVASRVIGMAARCYRVDNMAAVLRSNTLYEDLRAVLPRAPAVPLKIAHAVESAYQSSSLASGATAFIPDSVFLLLRRNRLHHALDVMNTPIPDEGWEYEVGRPLSFWLDETRACIVEATVELSAADPDIASLVAFGSSPGASKKGVIRSFISQPELRWLVKHAKVHITGGHVCSSRPVPKDVALPPALTADPLFALSYSAGLLAEMHWNAYASQSWSKNGGANGAAGKLTNTWGVWFRAMDRAISFEMALAAHKAGFMVSSYGNGSIRMRVVRTRLREAEHFANDIGICMPSFEAILRENSAFI